MKFCSSCGKTVSQRIPPGDNRERYVCDTCGTIFYHNPRLVVGCIAEWEDKILLCKRAIEPRYGLWTLPAGFMENGETTAAAGVRETLEEANAEVEAVGLFSLINIPYINQVYVLFRARLLDADFSAGSESLEVALFHESEIPWNAIAFPAISRTLRWYYEDVARGVFDVHIGDILQRPKRQPQ